MKKRILALFLVFVLGVSACDGLVVQAADTESNRLNIITYSKSVTSTDTGTDDISKITDGSDSTYWTSKSAIQGLEIVIELGGYYDLEEVVVRPYYSANDPDRNRSYFYDLYISENGSDWTRVAQHTTVGTTETGNSHMINSDVDAKYIKIVGTGKMNTGTYVNQYFHLNEVYAYGQETKNLASGKTFTSSSDDAGTGSSTTEKALDGDRTTYWDAGAYANKPWVDVDLGDVYSLDSVNVINYYNNTRYYQYEIYTSIDGVTYTKVAEKKDAENATMHGSTFEFDEGTVFASHIKVVGTYNSRNSAFHLNELRVYGELPTEDESIVLATQQLQSIVDEIYRSDYTEASWEIFEPTYEEALALLDKENATKGEIDEMKKKLENAMALLVYGNPDEKEEGTFRVGTFNIWAPNPNHPDVTAINEYLTRCELDYAGIQEVDKFNTRDNRDVLKLIASDDYSYNYNKSIDYRGGEYGIGQLSTTEMLEVSSGSYTKIGTEEGRSWMRMLVEVDGKEVAIYNTHLSLGDTERNSNINEILAIMEEDTCKYKIITGDYNATKEDMDAFKENYNLVNGQEGLWYSTFSTYGNMKGEPSEDITSGIDNIIISRNIEITSTRCVYHDGISDHYMLYADLKLLAYEEELQELIGSLDYKERDFTKETWAKYNEALTEAKNLLRAEDFTELQDELKAAIEKLETQISMLESRTNIIEFSESVTSTDIGTDDISKIMDGSDSTYWTSKSAIQGLEIVIELGGYYDLEEVVVRPYYSANDPDRNRSYFYDLYISENGNDWTRVAKHTTIGTTDAGNSHIINSDVDAKYIKIVGTGRKNTGSYVNQYFHLNEVYAYGELVDKEATETDYYIESLEQFNNFQEISKTNNFAGLTVHLQANIALDESFTGIGSLEVPFAGTFDGHGYAITKLSSTTNGLFVAVEGATIQNLVIGNAKITLGEVTSNVGVLAGTANGTTVDGVVISGSQITTETVETSAIGGMFGKVTGEVVISDSTVRRLVIKTAGKTSGVGCLVGYAEATVTIDGCEVANSYVRSNYASSTEFVSNIGGVIGYASEAVNATDVAAVSVKIQVASPVNGVGIMAGYLDGAASFDSCVVNVATITATANENTNVGEFVGYANAEASYVDCSVLNSTVKGTEETK